MPPRLNHRKSRNGCVLCKERKIKCGEEKPECFACKRHGVACTYSATIPPRSRPTKSIKSPSSINAYPTTIPIQKTTPDADNVPYDQTLLHISHDQTRQIELFLLHRFTSIVSNTFPSSQHQEMQYVWSRDAVQLSFEHSFLQNTILAISALYAALQQMSDVSVRGADIPPIPSVLESISFAQVHRVYMNMAVQQQRSALDGIDAKKADALGFASIMLSMMASKLLPGSITGNEYSPPMQALYISAATGDILQSALPVLAEGSPMMRLLRLGGTNLGTTIEGANGEPIPALFDPVDTGDFQPILDFQDPANIEEQTEDSTLAYTTTLAFIQSIYKAIQRNDIEHKICRRVMYFAAIAPRNFHKMLQEKRPRALVIFAHYMSMVKRVDQYWWFEGAAEKELRGIDSILPGAWKWAMDWPWRMVTRLGERDRNVDLASPWAEP